MSKTTTNTEILKKAIEKAVENGWTGGKLILELMEDNKKSFDPDTVARARIIFNHDFARAFWGNNELYPVQMDKISISDSPAWQYHLQQMVLEEDPISYLKDLYND